MLPIKWMFIIVGFAAAAVSTVAVATAVTPAQKCTAAQVKALGIASTCLFSGAGREIQKGVPSDDAKCRVRLERAFTKAESRGGASCATRGQGGLFFDAVQRCNDAVVAELGGSVARTGSMTLSGKYPAATTAVTNGTAPAGTLAMPYDATSGHATTLTVTRSDVGMADLVQTHWNFWNDEGSLLAEVFICLARRESVTIDPRTLRNEERAPSGIGRLPVGPIFDLSGSRGVVIVTAHPVDAALGSSCAVSLTGPLNREIVGAWSIADVPSKTAFGTDAIGLDSGGLLPPPQVLDAGLDVPFLAPSTLGSSHVILLALRHPSGFTPFQRVEWGPMTLPVRCDVTVAGEDAVVTSLQQMTFTGVGFSRVAEVVPGGDSPLIGMKAGVDLDRAGAIRIQNCFVLFEPFSRAGRFLFAFHGFSFR